MWVSGEGQEKIPSSSKMAEHVSRLKVNSSTIKKLNLKNHITNSSKPAEGCSICP